MLPVTKHIQPTADAMLQLADAMPQLVWIADAAGTITYFNIRVDEYRGARRRNDGLWEWQEMVHPDDLPMTAFRWQHCVNTGAKYQTEHRMQLANGSYRWHLTRALPQHDDDGNITHWYGTATDIDDHKKGEQVLRESEERFRLLTNSIPQIVWTVNAEGKTDYVNERWVTYTGQKLDDSDRAGRSTMIHPDDLPIVLDAWAMAQREVQPAQWEYRLRHSETERYRWFSAQVLPLKDENGRLLKWICAASDIQSHKENAGELWQQVEERTNELERLNEMLLRQTNALERSNQDLQQFAHVASHDLKEPLRKIRTFGDRLEKECGDQLSGRGREFLEKIETSAARMAQMIDGVLHYSLIDGIEPVLTPVPLEEIIQPIEADLEVPIQRLGAELLLKSTATVSGIPVLLRQLFFNLINNALKFARPDTRPVITLETREASPVEIQEAGLPAQRGFVLVTVSDNGIGFEPEYATRIFQTFTRLHPKDTYEGTGLGLALCHKIARRHGGAIRAEGRPGKGATFTVFLPSSAS